MEEAAQSVEFDPFASVDDSLRQGFILQHVAFAALVHLFFLVLGPEQ
jgi:hypothetical protein